MSAFVVVDVRGSELFIKDADSWECGGNGLKFIKDENVIAWFIAWEYFYKETEES